MVWGCTKAGLTTDVFTYDFHYEAAAVEPDPAPKRANKFAGVKNAFVGRARK